MLETAIRRQDSLEILIQNPRHRGSTIDRRATKNVNNWEFKLKVEVTRGSAAGEEVRWRNFVVLNINHEECRISAQQCTIGEKIMTGGPHSKLIKVLSLSHVCGFS